MVNDANKAGMIKYLNTLPFRVGIEALYSPPPFEFVLGCPTELNARMEKGELGVSLISAVEYLRNPSLFAEPLGHCIAARERVMSVSLYTRKPLKELSGTKIALTKESSSSVALLKVLLEKRWGVKPHYVEGLGDSKECDAFLLIGDAALSQESIEGYETVDLAAEWFNWTGLPMVFGLSVARKGVDGGHFTEVLEKGLSYSEQHPEQVVQQGMVNGLPEERLREYFQCLQYRFNEECRASLALFGKYL
jgi:chorismate dehydratase